MKEEIVAPDPQLLESMRSVGYSIEAAVADVIDNSIAAAAQNVDLRISGSGQFEIAIVDDGLGMSGSEAVDAMRLAARSPNEDRRPSDLGRFGLGLKTASLSQCRRLTLVSKRDGAVVAYRWDLDHVAKTANWSLLQLDPGEYESLLGWDVLDAYPHGTLVNWSEIDQLLVTEGQNQEALDAAAIRVRDHISLVFHRFLEGRDVGKVWIRVNGRLVDPVDPFLESHPATQISPAELIDVEGVSVRAQAYTLPYLSKLNRSAREAVQHFGQLRDSQGFYVYRAHRLVMWGTWFRVTPRTEMAKLTRVKVDIPNTLDHLWALDIKKSAADPPLEVRKRLKELASRMTKPSERVQRFRGRKVSTDDPVVRVWNLVEDRDEFRYEINRDHPDIQRLGDAVPPDALDQLSTVMNLVEATFPVLDSHNRLSRDQVLTQPQASEAEVVLRAIELWPRFKDAGYDTEAFIRMITASEPYSQVEGLAVRLEKEIKE